MSKHSLLICLRVLLGLIMISHGFARIYYGSIGTFGIFLSSKGLYFGLIIAWGITLFDIVGGLLYTLGLLKKWISIIFIFILLIGIIIVHFANGWFVVGHSSGGIEYSTLLIVCFALTGLAKEK